MPVAVLATLICALLAACGPPPAPSDTPPAVDPEPVTGSGGVGSVLGQQGYFWDDSGDLAAFAAAPTTPANLFKYVVLQDAALYRDPASSRFVAIDDLVRSIHARSPHTRVLIYKNLTLVQDSGDERLCPGEPGSYWPVQGSAIHYCQAAASPRDSWFLHEAGGSGTPAERLHPADGYHDVASIADIADPGYASQAIANIERRLARTGADGVFLDDVNVSIQHGLTERAVDEAALDTPGEWREANLGLVTQIRDALAAQGWQTLANVGAPRKLEAGPAGERQRAAAVEIARAGATVVDEGFARDLTGEAWREDVQYLAALQEGGGERAGAFALATGPAGDPVAERYVYASFLTAWNGGRDSAVAYYGEDRPPRWWDPAWTTPTAAQLGRPSGASLEVARDRWLRYFDDGAVLVNAGEGAYPFAVPGGPYAGSGVACTDGPIAVAPGDARVLVRC